MNTLNIDTLGDAFSEGLKGDWSEDWEVSPDCDTDTPEGAAKAAGVAVQRIGENVMGYIVIDAFTEGVQAGLNSLTKRDCPHNHRSERVAWRKGRKLALAHA